MYQEFGTKKPIFQSFSLNFLNLGMGLLDFLGDRGLLSVLSGTQAPKHATFLSKSLQDP